MDVRRPFTVWRYTLISPELVYRLRVEVHSPFASVYLCEATVFQTNYIKKQNLFSSVVEQKLRIEILE
jgi:hypothetical protein